MILTLQKSFKLIKLKQNFQENKVVPGKTERNSKMLG